MAAIETHGLTKRYGELTALDSIDLTVREGEAFGFLGPNGAGKSTAINLLLGFLTPSGGTGTVLGHDVVTESRHVRQRVGLLPEGYSPFDRLTAREHLDYAIAAKDADDDPDVLLDRTGLAREARDRPAGEYSTGMRQRLALATALVGDPELLILDEPSSGLDPGGMAELREVVREETERGTTVFFSSHVLPEVEAVCDRVGILRDGRFVAVDTVDGLRATLHTESTVTLSVEDPRLDVDGIDGVSSVVVDDSQLRVTCTDPAAKAAVIRHAADVTTVRDVQVEDASLEELFTTVTNGNEVAGSDAEVNA